MKDVNMILCPGCNGWGWTVDKPWKPNRLWSICHVCKNAAGLPEPPEEMAHGQAGDILSPRVEA